MLAGTLAVFSNGKWKGHCVRRCFTRSKLEAVQQARGSEASSRLACPGFLIYLKGMVLGSQRWKEGMGGWEAAIPCSLGRAWRAAPRAAPARCLAGGPQRPWDKTGSSLSTSELLEVLVAEELLKIITATYLTTTGSQPKGFYT